MKKHVAEPPPPPEEGTLRRTYFKHSKVFYNRSGKSPFRGLGLQKVKP